VGGEETLKNNPVRTKKSELAASVFVLPSRSRYSEMEKKIPTTQTLQAKASNAFFIPIFA